MVQTLRIFIILAVLRTVNSTTSGFNGGKKGLWLLTPGTASLDREEATSAAFRSWDELVKYWHCMYRQNIVIIGVSQAL